MERKFKKKFRIKQTWLSLLAVLTLFSASFTQAITVNVVGWDRATKAEVPISGFRWVLEEDNTHKVTPGDAGATDTLSLDFHASHSPVVNSGESVAGTGATMANIPLPSGAAASRYFISVLPHDGFSMSGVAVNGTQDASIIKIIVNKQPIPTAQISVFAYEDHFPLNNAPDKPAAVVPGTVQNIQELGLPNFDVLLFDAGGLYGQAGGQVIQDAFGNPLGTTYARDANGIAILNPATGEPTVQTIGNGVLKTSADGSLLISNLMPAKYGVQIVPPSGSDWQQTHTIEGSLTIDAWVKANEPSFFQEFGPPGHHVFIGFVSPSRLDNAARAGASTLSGRVKHMHLSRPPVYTFEIGAEVSNCWVGLNPLPLGSGKAVYASKCNSDGAFSIPNLNAGQSYQLVIWDESKFTIFASQNVNIPATGANVDLGEVAVFDWFARLYNTVFADSDGDGFPDANESGIPEQAINLRFRNGALYRAMPTDLSGEAPFDEVFPFFHWLVAEVDFTRFKATGVTYVVDAGGIIEPDMGWSNPTFDTATPQVQDILNPNTSNFLSRTDTGPILTKAFQQFLGQTSFIYWGKIPYRRGENGGISGIVYYATTRAEEQPQFAAAEEWEVGVPRVQVNLYNDTDRDGKIDTTNIVGGVATPILADVDNYPLGWSDGSGAMGLEDTDHNGNGIFDLGDAIEVTHTDSWDDSKPSGCQGDAYTYNNVTLDCYDGLRNFNQIRDGVFDGGYAFNNIPTGDYIVETKTPPGYQLLKEEDKNVDFGEAPKPAPELIPAECVGDLRRIPKYLSMQTDPNLLDGDGDPTPYSGITAIDAPFTGVERPLCDKKKVRLSDRTNAAADFYLFTDVPKASRVVGFMLNDLANEFDPNAPTFGEKFAPPWLPVSIKDWTGREITRVYSDQWGKYNALLPSTYTMNVPMPSGASPNMLTACMNDASPIANPNYDPLNSSSPQFITDPFFNRQFTQYCYTFQFMPGTTTYLDTPVLPIAAFATNGDNPVDCECLNGTPKIYRVDGPTSNSGPVFPAAGGDITIMSMGTAVEIANPAYVAGGSQSKTILRDYSFGTVAGTVTLGGKPLTVTRWTADSITATVPVRSKTGQLMITRGDNNKTTESGITLHKNNAQTTFAYVSPSSDPSATPIQNAIDAATKRQVRGGLVIMISPGIYNELVIMDKPVRLQGFGSGSVTINGIKAPGEKLQKWRNAIAAGLDKDFSTLPGQNDGININRPDNEPGLFPASQGPAIIVLGSQGLSGAKSPVKFKNHNARIDGMTITGGDTGGAIFVNGYADDLSISNMRIVANQGTYGGGIRIGDPFIIRQQQAYNKNISIHHNEILENGALFQAGGGIAIYAGTDKYQITSNRICGNFSQGHGGGIGHFGNSDNGIINNNTIIFNQSFSQALNVHGGGIFISGTPVAAGLTSGSGDVVIEGNLIQGNNAGAGDGAGIRAQLINGTEVRKNISKWYGINIIDNIIVNNVAGYAGGGISLADALKVNIVNNTIAHNDSTGTTESALAENPDPNVSSGHVAGIVSYAHSLDLNFAIPSPKRFNRYRGFAQATLVNNIMLENRSFNWSINGVLPSGAADFGLNLLGYDDLGVLPAGIGRLNPLSSLLTNAAGYDASNLSATDASGNPNPAGDPRFIAPYFNGSRGQTLIILESTTNIRTAAALDEGGNMIDVAYGPLTLDGGNSAATPGLANDGIADSNYHIGAGSAAIDAATRFIDGNNIFSLYHYQNIKGKTIKPMQLDFDDDPRPRQRSPSLIDIGADEVL